MGEPVKECTRACLKFLNAHCDDSLETSRQPIRLNQGLAKGKLANRRLDIRGFFQFEHYFLYVTKLW